MADTIQQYRGSKIKLPTLLAGQFGYCTDSTELYIGSISGNVLVGSGKWAETISSLVTGQQTLSTSLDNKLTASQADAVVALADTTDLASVITALNGVINALKAAQIMKQ